MCVSTSGDGADVTGAAGGNGEQNGVKAPP
jgi:hypothetical protein